MSGLRRNNSRVFLPSFLLLGLVALFSPAQAAVSAYRYRGGPGDGWDSRQASPAMYGGGAGAGNSMNISSNVLLSDLTSYPRRMSLEEGEQLVHWYIYDITALHDYDRTAPFGVHWFVDLSVESSSGWEESGLSQTPQTAWLIPPEELSAGTYTTTWYHADFYDKRLVFSVSSNEVRNFVYLNPRWTSPYRVLAAITWEGSNYLVNAWLEETSGSPATDAGNCQVRIVDAGTNQVAAASQASPNANGFFRLPIDIGNITNNRTYLTSIGIDDFSGNTFSNTITFALSDEADFSRLYQENAAILSNTTVIVAQTEGIRTNVVWLGTSYDSLSASFNTLNPKIDTLDTKMDTSLTGLGTIQTAVGATESETLYSKASATLNAVTGLPTAITREAKKGVQSKILNRPTQATNGSTVLIRYKTDSGRAPTITVYDQDAGNLVSDDPMTEITTSGVYQYNLTLLPTWPLGEYTIICSEATTGSADSMTLRVVANEAVAVDLSSVITRLDSMGLQLEGVAAAQDTMNTMLTTMSADLTTLQANLTSLNTTMQTVSDDVTTLLENWDSLNLTELNNQINRLVQYTGTPNDSGGMQTLFGKVAQTYGVVNQMPVAAVFAEVAALRKEVDFQGKTDTAYSMLDEITEAIDDLQAAGTETAKEKVSTELEEASETIGETREALGAIARQSGMGGIIPPASAGGKGLTLQTLYDQMTELKELSQAILDLLRQRAEPEVRSWLESGSVKQRILVVNKSKTAEDSIPVKEYLPKDVKPEDIISMGGFKLGYDFDRSLYFVQQQVKLAPTSSVILEVVMNDIWQIDLAEISMFRDHVKRLATILEQSRYADQAKVLLDSIYRRLDRIIEVQSTVTTTEGRLSNHEMNKMTLEEIKNDIGALEDLVVEVQGLPTDKVWGEVTPASAAAEPGALAEVKPPERKITLKIEVENPLNISNTIPLIYRLPAEIKPSLITDPGGLKVEYDPERKVHFLSATNLAFAPRETQSFAVVLNDIWFIPESQLEDWRRHAEKLVAMFADSEAQQAAEFLGKRIMEELAGIASSQQRTDLPADVHIGNSRLNARRMEDVKRNLIRLERLIVQTGGSPGLTLAERNVKIKEGGVIPAAGSKAKALGTVNTWRIIWTVISFTGIISFLFFVIWWMQIKVKDATKLEKLEAPGEGGKSGEA